MENEEKRKKLSGEINKIESRIRLLNEQRKKFVRELEELHKDGFSKIREAPSQGYNKEQQTASRKLLKNEIGVLVAPSASGKTILAIHAIARRKTNTLILLHRKPLVEQWRLQLASFLGVGLKDIGQIGAGKNKANGILDVAMIQSLERKGIVDDRIADYGFVIVDECHHISAVSFERVLMQARAKYILGLTATPYRRDGHQPIIHMQCGPISYPFSYPLPPSAIIRLEGIWILNRTPHFALHHCGNSFLTYSRNLSQSFKTFSASDP